MKVLHLDVWLVGTIWHRPIDGCRIMITVRFNNDIVEVKVLEGDLIDNLLNIGVLKAFWTQESI